MRIEGHIREWSRCRWLKLLRRKLRLYIIHPNPWSQLTLWQINDSNFCSLSGNLIVLPNDDSNYYLMVWSMTSQKVYYSSRKDSSNDLTNYIKFPLNQSNRSLIIDMEFVIDYRFIAIDGMKKRAVKGTIKTPQKRSNQNIKHVIKRKAPQILWESCNL